MVTRAQARVTLKSKGWSMRRAAEALGISKTHLVEVLSGKRNSLRLLAAIDQIPVSPVPYQHSGFALRKGRAA